MLLHAVTANMAVWLVFNLVDTLAQDYRVTAYDLRGHGLSEATPTGYTSADMAEDFRGLHDALGLGPAYLVGHSFGAVVAMHVAATYPDRVSGLILSDPYFPGLARLEPNLGTRQCLDGSPGDVPPRRPRPGRHHRLHHAVPGGRRALAGTAWR